MAVYQDEEERKRSEPQPGASPTIAPAQQATAKAPQNAMVEDDPFGFRTTQTMATTTAAPQQRTATANTQAPAPGSTQGYLESGLNQWLQQPSRYDSDLVRQGTQVIEQSLQKLRQQ